MREEIQVGREEIASLTSKLNEMQRRIEQSHGEKDKTDGETQGKNKNQTNSNMTRTKRIYRPLTMEKEMNDVSF